MKKILCLTALAILSACQKSVDQQFEAMCAEMKADPDAPRIGKEQCNNPAEASEATKKLVVHMYKTQRARLEAGQ